MRTLLRRISDPSFAILMMAVAWMFIAIFYFIAGLKTASETGRIQEQYGIYVWPKANPDLFFWEFKFGRPWIALIVGIISGVTLYLLTRSGRSSKQAVQAMVATAKGSPSNQKQQGQNWRVLLTVLAFLMPAFLFTYYFHL